MQCGTAPLALHKADFEDLANVCLNLHWNELYTGAGLSILSRKRTLEHIKKITGTVLVDHILSFYASFYEELQSVQHRTIFLILIVFSSAEC